MDNISRSLFEMLDSVKGDKCLENLVFRYCQNLELGESHWRESMSFDRFSSGVQSIEQIIDEMPKSKQQLEEEALKKENPNQDINLLWLQKKYGNTRS